MEKNTNMPNADDELCLKYVLNELDPSEVMLVERAMAEDQDTLIEVESLRATMRKLNTLPEHSPPAELRDKIMKQAREHAEEQYHASKMISLFSFSASTTYTAAAIAAMLLIGITYGVYQYSGDFNQNSTVQPFIENEAFAPAATSQSGTGVQFSGESSSSEATSSSGLRQLPANTASSLAQPWIDHNQVLRLQVSGNQNRSLQFSTENIRSGAAHYGITPLIPLQRSEPSGAAMMPSRLQDLQLTGSSGAHQ